MTKLVYTDKSSYLTDNFKTVNIGTKVFNLTEKKWYQISAFGTLKPDITESETEEEAPAV